MSGRIGKPCREPRCANLARDGFHYCEKHAAQEVTGAFLRKAKQRLALYNSAAWQRTRAAKLARDPVCEVCKRAAATQIHHKATARETPELSFSLDNLESICARCHARESARESRK